MRREIKGDEVLIRTDNDDEYRQIVLCLNKDFIDYKAYVGVLIVLTYEQWLNCNIEQELNKLSSE